MPSRMVARSRIETRSFSRSCSTRWMPDTVICAGTMSLTSSPCSFGSSLMQLLHLGVGQQLGGVGLEQLGQMRRQHGRGVHHRVALHRRFFLLRDVDPGRGQAEGRLGGVQAGQLHLRAGRVHDHVLARPDPAGAGLDLLDLDDVAVGLELDVVEDAHRRHHEAHLDRQRAPQRLDLLGEAVGAVRRIDQRQQRVAELDLEIVDLERAPRSARRAAGLSRPRPFSPRPTARSFCCLSMT